MRKKVKRLDESRTAVKAKNREKSRAIKSYQDREQELKQNRDEWKIKCKDQEKECTELNNKYKQMADLLEMKEEELRIILREFEELKKKYPPRKRKT